MKSYVQIEQLPRTTQIEIASILFEQIPELKDHWSWEYTLQEITGFDDKILLEQQEVDLNTLPATLNVSQVACDQYVQMFKQGNLPPPILLNKGKILDGCHRTASARKAGINQLTALELAPLLNMDWNAWLDGKTPANAPVQSLLGSA